MSLQAGGNVLVQDALDTISTLNTKSVVTTGLISSGCSKKIAPLLENSNLLIVAGRRIFHEELTPIAEVCRKGGITEASF